MRAIRHSTNGANFTFCINKIDWKRWYDSVISSLAVFFSLFSFFIPIYSFFTVVITLRGRQTEVLWSVSMALFGGSYYILFVRCLRVGTLHCCLFVILYQCVAMCCDAPIPDYIHSIVCFHCFRNARRKLFVVVVCRRKLKFSYFYFGRIPLLLVNENKNEYRIESCDACINSCERKSWQKIQNV